MLTEMLTSGAVGDLSGLSLPDTKNVRRRLDQGGPSTTFLDVALCLLEHVILVPGIIIEEVNFVRDCLQAGRSKTALPCVLADEAIECDEERETECFLVSQFTQSPSIRYTASQQRLSTSGSVHNGGDFCAFNSDGDTARASWILGAGHSLATLASREGSDSGSWDGSDIFSRNRGTDSKRELPNYVSEEFHWRSEMEVEDLPMDGDTPPAVATPPRSSVPLSMERMHSGRATPPCSAVSMERLHSGRATPPCSTVPVSMERLHSGSSLRSSLRRSGSASDIKNARRENRLITCTMGAEGQLLQVAAAVKKIAGRRNSVSFVDNGDCRRGPDIRRMTWAASDLQDSAKAVLAQHSNACKTRTDEAPTPSKNSPSSALQQASRLNNSTDSDAEIVEEDLTCSNERPAVASAATVPLPSARCDELNTLLASDLNSWGFNVFKMADLKSGRALMILGMEVMFQEGLFDCFCLDAAAALSFFERAEAGYATLDRVPYHSNLHAADVVQSVHVLLCRYGLRRHVTPAVQLALVLAAAIHDIGHDGRNNAFHVAKLDELAIIYNDQSVLEQFHAAQGFRLLLQEKDSCILKQLPNDLLTEVREEMISSILGTDMTKHMSHVSRIKGLVERLGGSPESWKAEGSGALRELQVFALHAADVSTSTKPQALADRWHGLLQEEFFQQGDEERLRQLPISPLCDRDSLKPAGSQVGFMQFIIQPTFSLLADIEPLINAEVMALYWQNLRKWQDRKTLESAEVAEAAAKVKKVVQVSEVDRFLGQGTIGTVFVCKVQGIEHEVAVKLLSEDLDIQSFNEVNLLKGMSSPFLLKIFDLVCDVQSRPIAIVMELCSCCTLWTLVHVSVPAGAAVVDLRRRLKCAADVASALEYLHSFLIVHKAVKPSNSFIAEPLDLDRPSSEIMVKLGDPGMLQVHDGTAVYLAPELLAGQREFDVSCDVFSCSILLHEVVSGRHPYSGQLDLNDPRSQLRIIRGLRPSLEALPAEALNHMKETLTLTWCRDASNRLTSEQLRQRLSSMLDNLDNSSCAC